MPSEAEIIALQKAAMFDLFELLGDDVTKSYTVEEIKKIVRTYLSGKESLKDGKKE